MDAGGLSENKNETKPFHRGTLNLRPIQKGEVRNPGGRPKVPVEAREAALALTPAAIRTLGEIMQDKKAPPATRVTAADKILDRALGRPAQTVDVHTTKHDALAYSIAELVAIAYKQGLDGGSIEPGREPGIDQPDVDKP
jgi:hypothetical protein